MRASPSDAPKKLRCFGGMLFLSALLLGLMYKFLRGTVHLPSGRIAQVIDVLHLTATSNVMMVFEMVVPAIAIETEASCPHTQGDDGAVDHAGIGFQRE